jgi:hypothetical protein
MHTEQSISLLPSDSPSSTQRLTLATQNLGLDRGTELVDKRYERFVNALIADDKNGLPDVIQLQEVDNPTGLNVLREFAGKYQYAMCYGQAYPGKERSQGLLTLTRWAIDRAELIDTGIYENKFLVCYLMTHLGRIAVINAHPETQPHQELGRIQKVARVIEHVSAQGLSEIILSGDLNSIAGLMPLVGTIEAKGFTSAYWKVHRKYAPTYPAVDAKELGAGRYVTPMQLLKLRALGALASVCGKARDDGLWGYTLDYALSRGALVPEEAHIFGPSETDRPVSDHWGLKVSYSKNQ